MKTFRFDLGKIIETVLDSGAETFVCTKPGGMFFFFQLSTGKVKFVYMVRSRKEGSVDISGHPVPVMVIADGRAYITDEYRFRHICSPLYMSRNGAGMDELISSLPDGLREKVSLLDDYRDALNDRIRNAALECISTLEPVPYHGEECGKQAELLVRRAVVYEEDLEALIRMELYPEIPVMEVQDAVDGLCGVCDLMADAQKVFLENADTWRQKKAVAEKAREYMSSPQKIMTEDEIRISRCLNKPSAAIAVNVTARFRYGGREACGKLSREKLRYVLARQTEGFLSLHGYIFSDHDEGNRVLDELGCGRSWGTGSCRDDKILMPWHIAEISYRGKTIYRKRKSVNNSQE